MKRFSSCQRPITYLYQCINCNIADKCDSFTSDKEGKKIRIEQLKLGKAVGDIAKACNKQIDH